MLIAVCNWFFQLQDTIHAFRTGAYHRPLLNTIDRLLEVDICCKSTDRSGRKIMCIIREVFFFTNQQSINLFVPNCWSGIGKGSMKCSKLQHFLKYMIKLYLIVIWHMALNGDSFTSRSYIWSRKRQIVYSLPILSPDANKDELNVSHQV